MQKIRVVTEISFFIEREFVSDDILECAGVAKASAKRVAEDIRDVNANISMLKGVEIATLFKKTGGKERKDDFKKSVLKRAMGCYKKKDGSLLEVALSVPHEALAVLANSLYIVKSRSAMHYKKVDLMKIIDEAKTVEEAEMVFKACHLLLDLEERSLELKAVVDKELKRVEVEFKVSIESTLKKLNSLQRRRLV